MDAEVQKRLKLAAELSSGMPGGSLGSSPEVIPLAGGGSERRFYRILQGKRSAVALVHIGGGAEFDSYLAIGEFLRRNGIGVPLFYGADRPQGVLLMEDLGNLHLEDALRGATADEELSLYRDCIGILVRLETNVTESMNYEGLLTSRLFDEDTLLGETDYFRKEFIDAYCPIDVPEGWERERRYIVKILVKQRRVFMHRDFQSRNIMIKAGSIRIVDFQTAHRGPGLYDAASLLKDPYHPLPAGVRYVLLRELFDGLNCEGCAVSKNFNEFYEHFTLAGIQRNLQALAAFASLGHKKGKERFLDSIPNCLNLVEEGIEESGRFPALQKMIDEIRVKLNK
ncbi:MAG: phosphotransferase [Candidatus Krumholzibacteria bacterium]|nr:phosphotransferase [Candidatus Krumholzibacteria bacterium]